MCSLQFPCKFQLPQVMANETSKVGFRTILSAEPQLIDVPTTSLLLNTLTFPTQPLKNVSMVKATMVFLIALNC